MTSETIVAVYDSAAAAEAVVRDLESRGVPSNAIETYSTERYAVAERDRTAENTADTIGAKRDGGFWSWLFGEGQSSAAHDSAYDRSLRSGGTVVTVVLQAADAARLMEVFERHNPIDMEEHAAAESAFFSSVKPVEAGQATGGGAERRSGLRSYPVTRPMEEQIRLRDETVGPFRRPEAATERLTGTGIDVGAAAPTGVGPGTETGIGTGGQSSGATTGRTGTF